MARTSNRNTPSRDGNRSSFPMAAAVHAYAGAIAVLDSSGNVKPGVTATGLITVGRFFREVDNTAGDAGDLSAEVENGIFRFDNSASADLITKAEIGDVCYIVDDETVAKTSATNTRSPAGIIHDVDDAGVWVRMGQDALIAPAGAMLAANNLSDLANAATALANLNAKLPRIAIQNDVTIHTGDGALATSGVNLITGGTGISGLTLAAPAPGDRCTIRINSLSSGSVVVTSAVGVTLDGTNNTATFDAVEEALVLVYGAANTWRIARNTGAVALSDV